MNAPRSRSRRRDVTGRPERSSARPGVAPLNASTRPDRRPDHDADEQDTDSGQKAPEEFEYSVVFDTEYGWMLKVFSGCPECGNDVIFNGSITLSPQFVGYKEDPEDDAMLLGQDDVVHVQVDYLWCGDCEAVVVDNRGDRAEDARNR